MASLVENFNNKREDVLTFNMNLAIGQIHTELEDDPFKTVFIVSQGCEDKNVRDELCRRFNAGGVKASVYDNGSLIKSVWTLKIEVDLPESLKPPKKEEEKAEEKVEEVADKVASIEI